MHQGLSVLIHDYLTAVESAVSLLVEAGIQRPSSNMEWACSGILQSGLLPGGIRYHKHGYGCIVHLPSGSVDFDFGEVGQINGFDAWRLSEFSSGRLRDYGFKSENELNNAFSAAVTSGELVDSGYILHYLAGGNPA